MQATQSKQSSKNKTYQIITDRVIEALKQGKVPWHKPWDGEAGKPRSLVSKKAYRGINLFMLSMSEFSSPYWLTFKQAKKLGGHVKKGQHGSPCIYWNWVEKENEETGKTRKIPFLRCYTVFNVEQCEGIEVPKIEPVQKHNPIEACELVIENMPNRPEIRHQGHRAFYKPSSDYVQLPAKDSFYTAEGYYDTMYHELVHSTGHKSRLARPEIMNCTSFGSEPYSKEELVAEMGAAFLAGHTGIENRTLDNSASYLRSWLRRFEQDNRLIVMAGAQAQKAADYILGENVKGEE